MIAWWWKLGGAWHGPFATIMEAALNQPHPEATLVVEQYDPNPLFERSNPWDAR